MPDDKNWTWVLERRCLDCGFFASEFEATKTGAAVRDLGVRWAAVLGRSDVAKRPSPAVWSPLEYGCHVRDVFRIFDRRLAMMIEQVDPRFENWDQDKTAIDDDYANQQAEAVKEELLSAAARLADRFDSVHADNGSAAGSAAMAQCLRCKPSRSTCCTTPCIISGTLAPPSRLTDSAYSCATTRRWPISSHATVSHARRTARRTQSDSR